MNTLLNIIWFLFGGFLVALEYFFGSILLMLTIVGIPFGIQSLKMAKVAFWPFGTHIETDESSSGCLNFLMSVLWLIFGGITIVLTHLVLGIFFTLTVVGIPFGIQHFKLMRLAFWPFGKTIS